MALSDVPVQRDTPEPRVRPDILAAMETPDQPGNLALLAQLDHLATLDCLVRKAATRNSRLGAKAHVDPADLKALKAQPEILASTRHPVRPDPKDHPAGPECLGRLEPWDCPEMRALEAAQGPTLSTALAHSEVVRALVAMAVLVALARTGSARLKMVIRAAMADWKGFMNNVANRMLICL